MKTRREWLRTCAAGYTATALGYPQNESISIGILGPGGRGRHLMRALERIRGVRMTALADVWDTSLAEARKLADPNAFVTKNYHELLERKDIDAVVIASPDHWHVPMTIDAIAAGKDVYVEKPMTHDLAEGQKLLDAHRRYPRVVQVGTQQRSMPHLIKAREIMRSGRLGKIHKVRMSWNRNAQRAARRQLNIDPATVDWKSFLGSAPAQPFDEYRFRNWRWFWDFGGGLLTDLMVHWLDTVNWMLDLSTPATATAIGDHIHAKGLWETPDTIQALFQYPDKELQAHFEGTFVNARAAAMTEFMGTEGTLYIDRGRYEVHPELKSATLKPEEWILGEGPRGADFYANPDGEILHLTNWLECIRSRAQPNTPVEEGVKAAATAHLGNQAYRRGQVVKVGRTPGSAAGPLAG